MSSKFTGIVMNLGRVQQWQPGVKIRDPKALTATG